MIFPINFQDTILLTTSRGIAKTKTLIYLLNAPIHYISPFKSPFKSPLKTAVVLAWGLRPSCLKAEKYAAKYQLPLMRLEDGFLRSIELGKHEPPLSIVIDDIGIYYDATKSSRLELLIIETLNTEQLNRAKNLIHLWQSARISKYNHARELTAFTDITIKKPYILVIDQTLGDTSIQYGLANTDSFKTMLNSALLENPHDNIVLKIHPDVLANHKRGHFNLIELKKNPRIQIIALNIHPVSLIEHAKAVYVVTSQMGFEALLWNKKVRTFGMPFYAGWGLTHDDLISPSRRQNITLEQLVYAALINYPRYINPETNQCCEIEELIIWFALQKQMRERFATDIDALGFSLYKRPIVRCFLAGSRIHFKNKYLSSTHNKTLCIWANNTKMLNNYTGELLHLEDGFIRSVGLGADLIRPLSWVIDKRGIYYDATKTSDLEVILQTATFDNILINRAKNLQHSLVTLGITKYNLLNNNCLIELTETLKLINKKIILVVGQVEDDASIKYGSPIIKTNLALLKQVRLENSNAYIIYKPHPDVIAGLRNRGLHESDTANYCNKVIVNINMAELLELITEVHTMTSLTGFEALLRGKKVVCYGQPFYCGWGLTEDKLPAIERRTRQLNLNELVAGALILYPTYVSRITNKFTTPEQVLIELVAWRDNQTKTSKYQQKLLRQLLKIELFVKRILAFLQ